MPKAGTLLIVDDNRNILSAVKLLADKYFNRVLTIASPNLLVSTMRAEAVDVVLLDMNFHAGINTGNEGLFWLQELSTKFPAARVVLFTAYADIDLAVRAMKIGAVDFVVKPWENDKLIETLLNAYRRSSGGGRKAPKQPAAAAAESQPAMFWGTSRAMARIRDLVDRVAVTEANILITGENGTGKEMLAREIHRLSGRSGREMVSLDMGAIPETLFESELFGHLKGAFTDARTDRVGKFEAADGSTLFLDEIGNLPLHMQAKMLSVLQNRSVLRLGSNVATPVDIRLIAATNRDLPAMVAAGGFRQDLLFRINTIHIELPPLRNRTEDIVPLAGLFLERYSRKYGKTGVSFTEEAAERLAAHRWEGNIRELQHTIEKALILCDGRTIGAEGLQLQSERRAGAEGATLEQMERRMIAEAIAASGGNLSVVARQLGITR